jgi:predicted nuclease with TOPRIM domain
MKHSGFTNDFPQDNHNYYSDNEQQKSNINTDDHIEPYTNRIFEKLTKENQDLLNKKIKLEAQYDLLQSKMTNLEFGFNEKDQIIVQLQDQLRTEKNKYADRDDKLSFSFNKVEILKQ